MAQTKKEKDRIKQIESMGFVLNPMSGSYEKGTDTFLADSIGSCSEKEWKETMESLSIEHEIPVTKSENVIPSETGTSVELQVSNTSIFKVDFNEATISKWKETYTPVTITSLTDKGNITLIEEGKKFTRKARTTLDKARKDLNQEDQDRITVRNNTAKAVLAILEPIEAHCDLQLEQLEKWKKEDDIRKDQEAKAEINRRVNLLKQEGMTFDGCFYVLGPTMSMDIVTIQTLSLVEFQTLFGKVVIEKKRLDDIAAKEEADRIAKEEADRVEREEFEKKKKEMEDQQKEIDRQKDEFEKQKAAMKKQVTDMRKQRLSIIGMKANLQLAIYYFQNDFLSVQISEELIENLTAEEFDHLLPQFNNDIIIALKSESDRDMTQQLLKERTEKRLNLIVNNIGMHPSKHTATEYTEFTFNNEFASLAITLDFIKSSGDDEFNDIAESLRKDKIEAEQSQVHSNNKKEADRLALIEEQKKKDEETLRIYSERSGQLIGIGMVIDGSFFTRRNQFGDIASISIDKVKVTDEESWGEMLHAVSSLVNDVNTKTQEKLDEIAKAKDALKPEIQKATEAIDNCWNSIKNVSSGNFNDAKIARIFSDFYNVVYVASCKGLKDLMDCEK